MIGKTNVGSLGSNDDRIGAVTLKDKSGDINYVLCNGAITTNANLLKILYPDFAGNTYVPNYIITPAYIKIT